MSIQEISGQDVVLIAEFLRLSLMLAFYSSKTYACSVICIDVQGVDVRDEFGNTPLIVACQNGKKRVAKLFLRYCTYDFFCHGRDQKVVTPYIAGGCAGIEQISMQSIPRYFALNLIRTRCVFSPLLFSVHVAARFKRCLV